MRVCTCGKRGKTHMAIDAAVTLARPRRTAPAPLPYAGAIVLVDAAAVDVRARCDAAAQAARRVCGVVVEELGVPGGAPGGVPTRYLVFVPTAARTQAWYAADLSVVGRSLDAQVGPQGTCKRTAPGYYACVRILHVNQWWERRRHLDTLVHVLAPGLRRSGSIDLMTLRAWLVGMGIGVHFHVVQNVLASNLAMVLGAPVRVVFVGFEKGRKLDAARALLRANAAQSTDWRVVDDILSVAPDKVPFLDELHISIPCAGISLAGSGVTGATRAYAGEEFVISPTTAAQRRRPQATNAYGDLILHCAVIAGAAGTVNPAVGVTFETTANSRPQVRQEIVNIIACARGALQTSFVEVCCEHTSAMSGKRLFVTSRPIDMATPVASAAAAEIHLSPEPATAQGVFAEYVCSASTVEPGVSFVVSAKQPAHFPRLMTGYYASSTTCGGEGRFAKYTLHVDLLRGGVVADTLSVPLGLEALSRLHGLRPWWLDRLAQFDWSVVCSLVSGAVPAGTVAHVVMRNFDIPGYVRAHGYARSVVLPLSIRPVSVPELLARRMHVEYRLCTAHWMSKLGQIAGTGAAVTVVYSCEPLRARLHCRATVDQPIDVHTVADCRSRVALLRLGWQIVAGGGALVRNCYPITLIAIEDHSVLLRSDGCE